MRMQTSLMVSLALLVTAAGVGRTQDNIKPTTPNQPAQPLPSFAFSGDGRQLVFRDAAGKMHTLPMKTDPQKFAHKVPLNAGDLAFSSDGQYLAVGGEGLVELRFLPCIKGNRTIKLGPNARVQWLAYQPGGYLLAVWVARQGCKRTTTAEVLLFDRDQLIRTLPGGNFAFSPDGKLLAVAQVPGLGGEPREKIWCASGKQLPAVSSPLTGPASLVKSVKFSPDGKLLAGLTAKGIQVWDTANGKEVTLIHQFVGPKAKQFFFSPDSTRVLVHDHHLTMNEARTGNPSPNGFRWKVRGRWGSCGRPDACCSE